MATIEGKNAVLEALRGGRRLKEVVLSNSLRTDPRLHEILRLAHSAHVPVRHVERRRLDTLSVRGAHQGVVARAEEFHYADLNEFLASLSGEEDAMLVVGDGVTDPQNLGSMIRTSEAAGAKGIIIGKHRAAGIGPATEKAAAGATEHLPIVQVTNVASSIGRLQEAGFWVTGTAAEAETELWDADFGGRIALVVGSEGKGITRLVAEKCDRLVRIPVLGNIESLNVAAATAIVLYEALRQRRERRGKTSG